MPVLVPLKRQVTEQVIPSITQKFINQLNLTFIKKGERSQKHRLNVKIFFSLVAVKLPATKLSQHFHQLVFYSNDEL